MQSQGQFPVCLSRHQPANEYALVLNSSIRSKKQYLHEFETHIKTNLTIFNHNPITNIQENHLAESSIAGCSDLTGRRFCFPPYTKVLCQITHSTQEAG